MNPYEKELLEETRKLAQENNKILKGLRTAHRWSTFFSFFYWILIVGVSVGAFYFLQPYVDTILKTYSTIENDFSNIKSVTAKIPGLNSTSTK